MVTITSRYAGKKILDYDADNLIGANLSRANLRGADLRGADLSGADLSGADLYGAYLYGANLREADLSRSSLYGTDLSRANLYGANLREADLSRSSLYGTDLSGANLYGTDLSGANLSRSSLYGTDLSRANLYGANLRGANMYGADLTGAKNVNLPIACPESGSFTAFKKLRDNLIAELVIPADAKRSSATGRKCRCDKVYIKSITSVDGTKSFVSGTSKYNCEFEYIVGQYVSVDNFCDNRWDECAAGIHFFITRQEAVEY